MNWKEFLFGVKSHPAPESKGMVILPPSMFWDSNGNSRTDTPGTQDPYNAYATLALCYACMGYRATKLVEAPLWVLAETEDGDEWVTDTPLAEVLEQPNPDMEMADLLELTSLYVDAEGMALWHKVRDNGSRVARLYPYAKREFTPHSGNGRLFDTFTLGTGQGARTVVAKDVVLFRNVDPRDHLSGLAPLSAALGHLGLNREMRVAVAAALANAIKPSAKIEVKDGFSSTEEADRFKGELTTFFGGARNTGKPIVLERATMEQLEHDLGKLQFGPVQGDVEAAVCQVFGIHPALIGAKIALENSSGLSDTIEPARDLFYDATQQPRWARWGKTLTRQLLREVDPDPMHRLAFDTSKVRTLQQDLTERVEEASTAAGFWTVNEARIHTGQEPLEDGDERGDEFVKAPAPAPVVDENGDLVEQAQPGKKPPAKTEAKTHRLRLLTARLQAEVARDRSEDALELYAAAELAHDRAAVLNAIANDTKALGDEPDGPPMTRAEMDRLVNAALDAMDERTPAWTRTMAPILRKIGLDAGQEVTGSVGASFNLIQPGILDFIRQETAFLVTAVTDTTKQEIRDLFARALEEGQTVASVRKRLEVAHGFSRTRAQLIAVTEVTRARNGASQRGMSDFKAQTGLTVTKQWVNSADERVRDAHQNAPHGVGNEKRAVDEPFSNGLMHPSEPNCRCLLLYSTEPAA